MTVVQIPAQPAPSQIYTRYVYVNTDGGWRWVSAQSTVVAQPVK